LLSVQEPLVTVQSAFTVCVHLWNHEASAPVAKKVTFHVPVQAAHPVTEGITLFEGADC
jgi:hypothetical protein